MSAYQLSDPPPPPDVLGQPLSTSPPVTLLELLIEGGADGIAAAGAASVASGSERRSRSSADAFRGRVARAGFRAPLRAARFVAFFFDARAAFRVRFVVFVARFRLAAGLRWARRLDAFFAMMLVLSLA